MRQTTPTDMTAFQPEDEARGLLAAITDSSDDAIIAEDLDGMIVTWNRGAERLYGYTAPEIIGRSISVLIAPGQPDELPDLLARVRAGERVEHYETVRRAKDGRLVDVSLTCHRSMMRPVSSSARVSSLETSPRVNAPAQRSARVRCGGGR